MCCVHIISLTFSFLLFINVLAGVNCREERGREERGRRGREMRGREREGERERRAREGGEGGR